MKKLGTPSGFRDLLSVEARQREYMIEKIIAVYKRFGFTPLETPVAEFEDVIVGDKATDFNLFRLDPTRERLSSEDREDIALRFDLTVPLARVVSQYGNELPRPFKRYQNGFVFRGERPQKGRYRQFMQCDADIVGAKTLASDIEIVSMIVAVMRELQVPGFVVRVNTRTLLNVLPKAFDFPVNILKEVLIVLDKVEKISQENFVAELQRLRVSESTIQKLLALSAVFGTPTEVVTKLESIFEGVFEAKDGIEELRYMAEAFQELSINQYIQFDMRIIRGFAYYTGPVFETNILNAPEFGSVMSGGRYDNLTERFMNQSLPAVGVSVGVDRLQTALHELGVFNALFQDKKMVVFSTHENFDIYTLTISDILRQRPDMSTDLYVGGKRDFKSLFAYAESVRAEFVCIVGDEEYQNKTVTIKNINTREQFCVSAQDVATHNI